MQIQENTITIDCATMDGSPEGGTYCGNVGPAEASNGLDPWDATASADPWDFKAGGSAADPGT